MITLIEFLAPLKKSPRRDLCLAVLYYFERYKDTDEMSVEQVRTALGQARVPKASAINVADVLAKSGHYVDAAASDERGRKLWRLTEQGRQHVRAVLDLPTDQPEIELDVSALRRLASSISDPVIQGFVEEGVTCLSVGAFRAAIVFLWSGAIRVLQDALLSQYGHAAVSAAIAKHDPKARPVRTIEDFSSIKDRITLLAARELSLLDKGQWTILQADLDLRNQCSHPTKFKPGPKKASSLIEDLLNNVF